MTPDDLPSVLRGLYDALPAILVPDWVAGGLVGTTIGLFVLWHGTRAR